MENKCSHLARVNTASWRKSGWPAFKTYSSSTGGFWFDRNTMTCQVSSKVAWVPQAEYVPNKAVAGGKTQGDLDGFMKVPAAGQEDVYRFATEVVMLKDAIVQLPADDATAEAAGGWSAFIAPSAINGQNPPLMQLPVEVYVKPGYN